MRLRVHWGSIARLFMPAAVAVSSGVLGPVRIAQAEAPSDPISTSAVAIAAYEAGKEHCIYSEKLGTALKDIDGYMARKAGANWDAAKAAAPDALILLRNMTTMLGAKSVCVGYGAAIGSVLQVYILASPFDPEVLAELSRLLNGGGRSKSGEDEARPDPPPDPGSAVSILKDYNRQNPDMNAPVDTTGGMRSTIQRLPADPSPHEQVYSKPPPRESTKPRDQQGRSAPTTTDAAAASTALAQAAPRTSAPPPPPTVASSVQVPTSSHGQQCRIGVECRLAEATFACNIEGAARIADAGPDRGRELGVDALRTSECATVAAGRPLVLEASKFPNVVYATEEGKHVGYLPVGVFAPSGGEGMAACLQPGFCAVRPGRGAWICPGAKELQLATQEEKVALGCKQLSGNSSGEVTEVDGNVATLVNMFGGEPPYAPVYYVAKGDLIALDLQPKPKPMSRGWCRPGDWCVTSRPTMFCLERAAYQRILAAPVGETRRQAALAEHDCRVIIAGNPMKPSQPPSSSDTNRLIEVDHPVLKHGWASADAFKTVSYAPPIRYTAQLTDIVVNMGHNPLVAAVSLKGQGTDKASGLFRATAKQRLEYCRLDQPQADASTFQACLDEPDNPVAFKADCEAKKVVFENRAYALRERPSDAPADIHIDPGRHWLFQDLSSGDWLDGTSASREQTISTAFDALCPGTNPNADGGIAYRDPRAR